MTGRLQSRSWQDKHGQNRVTFEVVADHCYFAERTDGVSKDIQEIFAAMGKQPWHRLRIRTGGKNGKSD